MDIIKLYTTHCPKCKVIESKLNNKNIEYIEISDIKEIQNKGFMSVPVLEVNENIMDFTTANTWINNYKN